MRSKFYISLAFLLSLVISDIIAAPLLVAAIDISIKSEKKSNASHTQKSDHRATNTTTEVSESTNNDKRKVMPLPVEKNEKLIQGYRTTRDRKGNEKTEYVYGVVKKGKNNLYSGYLYGKENKQTFVYGDPSTGSMQENSNEGTISVDSPQE